MATVTLSLPPETERKLREKAGSAGLTIEGFLGSSPSKPQTAQLTRKRRSIRFSRPCVRAFPRAAFPRRNWRPSSKRPGKRLGKSHTAGSPAHERCDAHDRRVRLHD